MNNKESTILPIYLPDELGGEIECEIIYHIENDGIGPYEFWGAPGFDRGEDFVQIDDIIPIFVDDNEQQAEILQWIDENFWRLEEELAKKIDISNDER